MSAQILKSLGLDPVNSGTYLGHGEWSKTTDAGLLQSINPSTNEVIAEVHSANASDYETIIRRAQAAFATWRVTPAPRRGEAIRLCSDALRTHKDALGSLVALDKKTGKQVWRVKSLRDCWCSPLLVDLPDGKHEVVLNTPGKLFGIDPDKRNPLDC